MFVSMRPVSNVVTGSQIYIAFAWAEMTPTLGGSINQAFFSQYDQTVQSALNSGPNVHVIVDLVRDTLYHRIQTVSPIIYSTTTLAGTTASSLRAVPPTLSSRAFGLNSRRSTLTTTASFSAS